MAAVVGITKLTSAMAMAAQEQVSKIAPDVTSSVSRAHLTPQAHAYREMHCGGGLFLEAELTELNALASHLAPKDQTLAVYGFSAGELQALAQSLPNRAVDRIVSVGRALEFQPTWDGQDLLRAFTRVITISV
jgi:hypothetical protein